VRSRIISRSNSANEPSICISMRDLAAFAERAGYQVVVAFKETASGVRLDRTERKRVLALVQRREIDAVLVTELSRWGRSTTDLLATLKELEARRVSLVAPYSVERSSAVLSLRS
jgi:putative DNA-invertase from lambdoid prophage Rac